MTTGRVRRSMNRGIGLAAALCTIPGPLLAQGSQPSLASVIFKQATVAGGTNAIATISLSAPAGQGGFEVALSVTSNVAHLSLSAVTIGSGLTSATVVVGTTPTTTLQLAVLSASARGETRTGNLTVSPPTVLSLGAAPSPVTGGQQATGTITLDGRAPGGGTLVMLVSNNPAVTFPPSATVSQGQTSTTFPFSTGVVTAQTAATLTASVGVTSRIATLTVLPASVLITSFGPVGATRSGDPVTFSIRINNPAPEPGLFVQLASTGVDIFRGRTLDTIPAGRASQSRMFRLPTTNVDAPFELTARLDGITTVRSGTLLAPRIAGVSLPDTVVGGLAMSLRLSLNATHGSGLPVVISTDNPAVQPPGAVSGLGHPYSVTYVVRTNPVTQPTPVQVTIAHLGTDRQRSVLVLPEPPVLTAFTVSPTPVRAGRNVSLTVTLSSPAPRGGIRIQLGVPALPPGMDIPGAIVIPPTATSGSVSIATPGLLPGGISVRLTASFDGVTKSATVRIDP